MPAEEREDPVVRFAKTKRRVALVLLSIFVLASLGGMAVLHPLLQREFLGLEADEGVRHWYRAANTLKREASALMAFARDWATWDDMYDYVLSRDPEFEKSSLADTTFNNLHLALIAVYNEQGESVWGRGWDHIQQQPSPFSEFLPKLSSRFLYLRQLDDRPDGIAEVVPTSRGLMVLTSLPILKSDGSGPRRGFLVMARAVDKQFCSDLGDRLGLAIDIQTSFDTKGDREMQALLDRQAAERRPVVDGRPDQKNLVIYGPVLDDRGRSIACLKVETDRAILIAGRQAMMLSVISTLCAGLVMLLTVFSALQFLGKAHRQIERSERRFRALAEETMDAIIRVDSKGRCIYINPSAARMFSLTQTDVLGKTLDAAQFPSSLARALKDAVQIVLTVREVRRIDCEIGDGRWMDWLSAPELEADGRVSAIVLSGRDISERVSAEREIKKARDLAEQASQMKSRFVSNVSHDIRTPLNGIIGYCEMISSASSLKEAKDRAASVLGRSEVLLQLVNDLLDSAKMEQGKLTLEPRAQQLRGLIEEVRDMLHLKAEEKHLSLMIEVDEDVPPWIVADGLRLKQILINLVSNALKFTEHGRIAVRVQAVSTQKQEKMLRLSVEDTGIGIPEDKQAIIFEAFTQGNISTTRKYGGTGLGTTIVRDLALLMGGSVGVKSKEGQGSTFWVDIPLLIAKADDIEQAVLSSLPPFAGIHPNGRARILLAEDYPVNRELVVHHLSGAGHEIIAVENGRQAVERADSAVFDLILMDLHMPLMDGFEAAGKIRRAGALNAGTPIVALTADAESATREECLNFGMDDVITKPIRVQALMETVNLWLSPTGNSARLSSAGARIRALDEQQSLAPSISKEQWNTEEDNNVQPTVFDSALALEQFGGNAELLRMSLEHLINKISSQIHAMREMATSRNGKGIRAEAHKIKGGASSLCAMRVAAHAASLEASALSEQPEVWIRALDEMEHEVRNLVEASRQA